MPASRPRRPRLLWIPLSWALVAVLFVTMIISIFPTVRAAAPTTTFDSGERVTVHLDPGDDPAIYMLAGWDDRDVRSRSNGNRPRFRDDDRDDRPVGRYACDLFGGSPEGLSLTEPTIRQTVGVNGVNWLLIAHVEVPAPGEYQVTCEGDYAPRFGVGATPEFGLVITLGVLAAVAFAGAAVTTVVVLLRRRRSGHGVSR